MNFQTTPSTEHAPVHAGPGEELQRSSHVRRACVAALAQAFLSQTLQVVSPATTAVLDSRASAVSGGKPPQKYH